MATINPKTGTVIDLRPLPRNVENLDQVIQSLQVVQENQRRIVEALASVFAQSTDRNQPNPLVGLVDLQEVLAL